MYDYPNNKKIIYHNGWWHGNNTVFTGLFRTLLPSSSWETNITGVFMTPKNSSLRSVITMEIHQEKTD
jgi:hypothetical protein